MLHKSRNMENDQTPPHHTLLPFHLMFALMHWQSSQAALHGLKKEYANSKPSAKGRQSPPKSSLPPELENLFRKMSGEQDFEKLIDWQINQQQASLFDSIRSYSRSRYHRHLADPPVAWKRGSTRLLEYSRHRGNKRPVLLLTPSLINRFYILDLNEKQSFARHLAAQGFDVYLLDWGNPGKEEKGFAAAEYVTEYLHSAFAMLRARHSKQRVIAIGHCMGGMLGMGLAALAPTELDGLGLLATPWDFRPLQWPIHKRMKEEHVERLEEYINSLDIFPGDQLLMYFYLRDPFLFYEKLQQFKELEDESEAKEHFLALEYWVNDVAPITSPVAHNCFIDWLINNTTLNHQWKVADRVVRPDKIRVPCFLAIPERDKIVPPESSYILDDELPFATTITPDCGHVGMVVGSRAKQQVWDKLSEWAEGL